MNESKVLAILLAELYASLPADKVRSALQVSASAQGRPFTLPELIEWASHFLEVIRRSVP